jgi:hypothetical protein
VCVCACVSRIISPLIYTVTDCFSHLSFFDFAAAVVSHSSRCNSCNGRPYTSNPFKPVITHAMFVVTSKNAPWLPVETIYKENYIGNYANQTYCGVESYIYFYTAYTSRWGLFMVNESRTMSRCVQGSRNQSATPPTQSDNTDTSSAALLSCPLLLLLLAPLPKSVCQPATQHIQCTQP